MAFPQMLSTFQANDPLGALVGTPYYGQATNQQNQNYNAYSQAFQGLQGLVDPSLQNYDTQTGLAQKSALGSLNARGMGNSLLGTRFQGASSPISGYGSGALQQLAQQRLLGRNQMQQGFTDRANQLNNNFLSNTNALQSYYQQLGLQSQRLEAQEQAQQPNILNLAELGISLL